MKLQSYLHVICLLSFNLLFQIDITASALLGNETDRLALLKFKESIRNDSNGIISSWNDSVPFCGWLGITCSIRHHRVTALKLAGHELKGSISPYIGNLTFLRFVNLSSNSFSGEIPQQVGHLYRLRHLILTNNTLEGVIPVSLVNCSKLRAIDLRRNRLTGDIPMELGSLVKLELLQVSVNNLSGTIPPSLGNVSTLKFFSAEYNNLVGNIPNEIGRLKNLYFFAITANKLSGTIPNSLYNLTSLRNISLGENHLNGTLQTNIGVSLPNLKMLVISGNEFYGPIPVSLSNASQLQKLDLATNNFVGQVPKGLGNLLDIRRLSLGENHLGNNSSHDLGFLASFQNCSKLETLDLSSNHFGGFLPEFIGNLSSQLTQLYIGRNYISGNIPESIGNLVKLIGLDMEDNLLTGILPESLSKLGKMQKITFAGNRLSGKISSTLGNLTQLFFLDLSHNKLEGSIPPSIGNCQNLKHLDISTNNLSGEIPPEVFLGLSFLSILLNLSENTLTGSLPEEVRHLENLNALDLSENKLSGKIPQSIEGGSSLETLFLQGNTFDGSIPATLAFMRGLRLLDLSRNNLSGHIPLGFVRLLFLNLSFNDLEGEVPKEGIFRNISARSLVGNTKLCSIVLHLELPACPITSKQGTSHGLNLILIIIICATTFSLLFTPFLVLYWRRKSQRKLASARSKFSFLPKVSYKRLYKATNGFSPHRLIGTGSFSSVYTGIFNRKEILLAVKVFNLQLERASKSFIVECKTLRNIRHRNLVKILTCCSSMDYNGNEFKALVFQYMSNGSLNKRLHLVTNGENLSRSLNLIQRLNIAIDVASALCYLHIHCEQPIIHCDLKPSNILLDHEMVAHISDFGLARLISATTGYSESKTSRNEIKGTIGYIAPEYGLGGEPSRQGDVYSYGIVVLEMFTGRKPTDEMFTDDFNLYNFVNTALPERLEQIVDSTLLTREVKENTIRREDGRNYINNGGTEIETEEGNINFQNPNPISPHILKCLVSVLKIGLACSNKSPKERISIEDVTKELQRIKDDYMEPRIHGQRQENQLSNRN